MATTMVTRLAPVNARDGVDTRNQDLTLCPLELHTGVAVDGRSWGDIMIGHAMPDLDHVIYVSDNSPEQVDFNLWCDMVEDPAKYGDDIIEWLALNDALVSGPKRWRMSAFWQLREMDLQRDAVRAEERLAEEQAEWRALFAPIAKTAAATGMKRRIDRDVQAFIRKIRNAVVTIQAATRGWLVRKDMPAMDCCMCLVHTKCHYKTDKGYMCGDCGMDDWHNARVMAESYEDSAPCKKCQLMDAEQFGLCPNCLLDDVEEHDDELIACKGCGRHVCFPDEEPYCSRACKYE